MRSSQLPVRDKIGRFKVQTWTIHITIDTRGHALVGVLGSIE